jgi:L-rhamnonate dehydratase
MDRRAFVRLGGLSAMSLVKTPPLAFGQEKSKLKITGVRIVNTRPKRPVPLYKPAPGAWSTGGVEVANPMSIYPEYKATRSLFQPDPGKLPAFTVEIATDKGVKGYGSGGPGGGYVVEQHFTKLLMGEDPFNVERIIRGQISDLTAFDTLKTLGRIQL